MPDFEAIVKLLIIAVAFVFIPVGAYAAIAATRAIWIRGDQGKAGSELQGRVDTLEAHVAELEGERARLLELEERVDFAERLLTSGKRTED